MAESNSLDFGFAFNDTNLSDRILRIEIIPELHVPEPDSDDCTREGKRRRIEPLSNGNCDEVSKDNEPSFSMEYSGLQVRSIHVSSPILAAMSPFFYKLFSNGMMESKQRHATLRIQASDGFMDMLKFMYTNTLPTSTSTALLDVLMAADKFDVASCMRYCIRQLCILPMTCESALIYLDLPSILPMVDVVQLLTDAAKKFLADRFKDLKKNQEEVFNMPLIGIEAILSSDDLEVDSEDNIFDFMLTWAKKHYPDPKERRELISNRLLWLIRFPCMTYGALKLVLDCEGVERRKANKVVFDALFFKAGEPYQESDLSPHQFVRRSYKYRPMKVVEFENQCIAYLELRREECERMFPSNRFYTNLKVGEWRFCLYADCNINRTDSSSRCFGMFIRNIKEDGVKFVYEFAARMRPWPDYVGKLRSTYSFTDKRYIGNHDLFATPWTKFMADDSPYFFNGVLYLRAKIAIKN